MIISVRAELPNHLKLQSGLLDVNHNMYLLHTWSSRCDIFSLQEDFICDSCSLVSVSFFSRPSLCNIEIKVTNMVMEFIDTIRITKWSHFMKHVLGTCYIPRDKAILTSIHYMNLKTNKKIIPSTHHYLELWAKLIHLQGLVTLCSRYLTAILYGNIYHIPTRKYIVFEFAILT